MFTSTSTTFEIFNFKFNTEDTKCYKICQNKKPISTEVVDYDTVKFETDCEIGWVVQKPYVVVDIDNKRDAKKIWEILNDKGIKHWLNLSKKGGHFIFKDTSGIVKQTAKKPTPIGIEIDTRVADKGYIILPENQEENGRKWQTNPMEIDDVDEIPSFLYPQHHLKDVPDFINMLSGTSRNSDLFSHYMKLGNFSNDLDAEQIEDSIRIINSCLFKEPLDDKELEKTVLRTENKEKIEDNLKKANKKENNTRVDKLLRLAETIVNEEDIATIGGASYIYNGKFYKRTSKDDIHKLIFDKYISNISEADRKEVIRFIDMKTGRPVEDMDRDYHIINVKNGRLNLMTKELQTHTAAEIDTVNIDREYRTDVKRSERIESLMDFYCNGDDNKRSVILEMIGQILMKSNIFQISYMLYGGGNNGKSTLLNIIERMIGAHLCTHLEMGDLRSGFMINDLAGKLVNLADDISIRNVQETNILKKLISGEVIRADVKFEKPIEFSNYATMIFATNKLPRSSDTTDGFFRRFMIIDFERKVENPDRTLLLKINKDDLDYLFKISIDAISDALNKGNYTKYHKSDDYKNRYMKEVNSVSQFLVDMGLDPEELHKTEVATTYAAYSDYCKTNGYKPYSNKSFREEVCIKYGLEVKRTTNKTAARAIRWVYPGEVGSERVKRNKQGLD